MGCPDCSWSGEEDKRIDGGRERERKDDQRSTMNKNLSPVSIK